MKISKDRLYGDAVAWIALNDEPTITDPYAMETMISVQLVADVFDVQELYVAQQVVALRTQAMARVSLT